MLMESIYENRPPTLFFPYIKVFNKKPDENPMIKRVIDPY